MSRVLAIVIGLASCVPAWKNTPHDQLFQTEVPATLIRQPKAIDPSDWWNKGTMLFVRPLGRLVSPGTYAQALFGGPEARDVNHLGQVPDSGWFENRIGRRAYKPDEVFAGAANDAGLAAGPLLVISGKIDGVSAGFVIRDSAGTIWYLKMDHPAFPELSTSAEVIASRLLWLAGYRVPSMHAVDVDRDRFVLDAKAKTRDRYNRSVPLRLETLQNLLVNTNPDTHGRIRVLVSRKPPGKILGPFSYRGTRPDDASDTIPHEHRRSLRGLWLFSAWLNNTDTRDDNTLDMFRPTSHDGRGVIDHYLIDFGDSFGSTGLGEKAAMEGWEHLVDWRSTFINLITLGLRYPDYNHAERSAVRSVGRFEAKVFEPAEWRPEIPNPAFDQRTRADEFWAASILARIQPEHIRAAIAAGHYREEGAVTYVIETLLERRRKLLEHAFAGFLELDRPRVEANILHLDNLRVLGKLPAMGDFKYVVRHDRTYGRDRELARGVISDDAGQIDVDLRPILAAHERDLRGDPFVTVTFTRHGGTKLEVHLRLSGERLVPVGVDR
jgi:hypothetical protein